MKRIPLVLMFLVIFAIPVLFTYAQGVGGAGGFVPCSGPDCQACHVVALAQNILEWLIVVGVFVIGLIFAIGGLKITMSAGNTEAVSSAKSSMTNAIIGLIIMLAAWLIIDTVFKLFINTSASSGSVSLGVWNEIQCAPIPGRTSAPIPTGATTTQSGTAPTGAIGSIGSGLQCSPLNPFCNPGALQAAGFNAAQANAMSCIAMTESSGVANIGPHNERNPGSNSSACGLFQITRTTWKTAASGSCSNFEASCRNAKCNTEVAKTLVTRNGYRDWTCPRCNNKAQACINKYDPR